MLADGHLAGDARAQHQTWRSPAAICSASACAALCAMLSTRLDQLLAVAAELRDRGVVVALHLQAAGELGQHQRPHPLADLVDVDVAHHVRLAVRRQQPVDQRLQAVGLANDDLGVFGQLALSFSSISSSCAAPRMPPSGFLISCARLRISSLLAWAWS